jgi:hypothetical protein
LPISDVDPDAAIEVASGLYPCTSREATDALRLGALEFGTIDRRVLTIRDRERANAFRAVGFATYIPWSSLPEPRVSGVPAEIDSALTAWSRAVSGDSDEAAAAPKRLLISGPSGYGKTWLALTLAERLRRPVIQMDAARCVSGQQGASESALRLVLGAIALVGNALVLVDDVDRMFNADPQPGAPAAQLAAIMTRLTTMLSQWLDQMPPGVVAVMTSARPERLPGQWRRRMDLALHLDHPARLDDPTPAGIGYRTSVLTALFRKFRLDDLARDAGLMRELAVATHPNHDSRERPLLAPIARRAERSALAETTCRLSTGADLEWWMTESITLLCPPGDSERAQRADFWRAAAR